MKDYYIAFRKITGIELRKRQCDYRKEEEIDENLFERISRLFFENKKAFYYLKKEAIKATKSKKDALLFSTAGYFSYVDCDFLQAKKFFEKAIEINPEDLEPWLCLAFCLRQLGEDDKFDLIILNYRNIINKYIHKKTSIERLLSNKKPT